MSCEVISIKSNIALIDLLERFVEYAKDGTIGGVAIVASTIDGEDLGPMVATGIFDRPLHERNQIQAGLAMLTNRIARDEDERSVRTIPKNPDEPG